MKKGLTFTVIFLCIAIFSASAQTFRLGPKAGINYSRINMKPDHIQPDENSLKFGYQGGWVFNWMLSDMFSMQQEVLFQQKGNKIEDKREETINNEVFEIEYEEALTLNYIDLPLMFRFGFGDPYDKQFFINFGPRVGFLVGGNRAWNENRKKKQPDDGFKEERQGVNSINESNYEKAEFGVDLGLGYSINTGPGELVIDLRWNIGASDIMNEGVQSETHRMTNQGVSASLNFLFGNRKPVITYED